MDLPLQRHHAHQLPIPSGNNDELIYKTILQALTTSCCLQVIQEGGTQPNGLAELAFYLDGAHTQESMSACAHWFADSLTAEQASIAEASPTSPDPKQHSSEPSMQLKIFVKEA